MNGLISFEFWGGRGKNWGIFFSCFQCVLAMFSSSSQTILQVLQEKYPNGEGEQKPHHKII
jgi:hypothetical protein